MNGINQFDIRYCSAMNRRKKDTIKWWNPIFFSLPAAIRRTFEQRQQKTHFQLATSKSKPNKFSFPASCTQHPAHTHIVWMKAFVIFFVSTKLNLIENIEVYLIFWCGDGRWSVGRSVGRLMYFFVTSKYPDNICSSHFKYCRRCRRHRPLLPKIHIRIITSISKRQAKVDISKS